MAVMTNAQLDLIKNEFKTLKERSPFYATKFACLNLNRLSSIKDTSAI